MSITTRLARLELLVPPERNEFAALSDEEIVARIVRELTAIATRHGVTPAVLPRDEAMATAHALLDALGVPPGPLMPRIRALLAMGE